VYFQSFLLPYLLHTLMVDQPTFITQHSGNTSVTITTIRTGQLNDALPEQLSILWDLHIIALGGSSPTFGDIQSLHCLPISVSFAVRRNHFFPNNSFKIALSRDRPATSFFKRIFSFSISLSFLAWVISISPYFRRQ